MKGQTKSLNLTDLDLNNIYDKKDNRFFAGLPNTF